MLPPFEEKMDMVPCQMQSMKCNPCALSPDTGFLRQAAKQQLTFTRVTARIFSSALTQPTASMDMFVARTMHGVVRNAALYAQGRYRISPLDDFLWTSCLDRDMMG